VSKSNSEGRPSSGVFAQARDYVDYQNVRLQMLFQLKQWDEEHPYATHRNIARVALGLFAYGASKSVLRLIF
jgi:hypothetical protein